MLGAHGNIRSFPIAILATPGGGHLAEMVDKQLKGLAAENGEPSPPTFLRQSLCHRFQNGEGKGVLIDSIRGTDLYVIVDVSNHGVKYVRHGVECSMSPDEHFQDLKRLLGAVKNVAQRMTVVMPLLYESRQHKMNGRESLDCAMALQELERLNVHSIMTIDAHNSHVMNAIPMTGLENLHATYQLTKAFLKETNGNVRIDPDDLFVASPDLGGMERARYFAEHFKVHLAGFWKQRDLTRVVNGKNPILEHKFLGGSVAGKSALVVDDLLASGGSLIEVCHELKQRQVKDIFLSVTFALFSEGYEAYDEAYEQGMFTRVFGTNGTWIPPELLAREWFVPVDVTKFIAKFIRTFNQDKSVSRLLDSTEKINKLLGRTLGQREMASSQASAG